MKAPRDGVRLDSVSERSRLAAHPNPFPLFAGDQKVSDLNRPHYCILAPGHTEAVRRKAGRHVLGAWELENAEPPVRLALHWLQEKALGKSPAPVGEVNGVTCVFPPATWKRREAVR